ncbi:MAG: hypothetical protein US70_C0025G0012 [Parcubacteria group bacterium GW2011_GWD2_38_11]|nr:MAG: hypothetical protein US70_C0025G0012 [Parcubacteria group bacterium GW2011_GWD2_38_11]
MTEEKEVKTFEEIEEHLKTNLMQIGMEIAEIENFLKLGEELLEKERKLQEGSPVKNEEIIAKYKNDIEKLQKGLEMFLGIRDEMQNTLAKLAETKAKADEHIN